MIVWFTGMSGAGKSTLTKELNSLLKKKGFSTYLLDGDAVRKLNKTSTHFTKDSILENNKSIIHECVKNVDRYDFVIVSVISPFEETRHYARQFLKEKYFEIYVKCSIEKLIQRDTKGLYQKAMSGQINNLIGFSEKTPYEEPLNSNLIIRTDHISIQDALCKIFPYLQFDLSRYNQVL